MAFNNNISVEFQELSLKSKNKQKVVDRRKNAQFLLSKFKQQLHLIKCTQREDILTETKLLLDILEYQKSNISLFFKCFVEFFNLKENDWQILKQEHVRRSKILYSKAMEYKRIIEKALNKSVNLTGSVASETAEETSDFDYGIEGDVNIYAKLRLEGAFENSFKSIVLIHARVKLITIRLINGDKIDVVGQCQTLPLQTVLCRLNTDQKLVICFLKVLLKNLKLIDSFNGRLPSCFISIAVLCANNDSEFQRHNDESLFAQICRYIGDFEFDAYQMTTKGPIKKPCKTSAVQILDIVDSSKCNNAGRTTTNIMTLVKLWMDLFREFKGIENFVGSMKQLS